MCLDFIYNFLTETFSILRIIQRDVIVNVHAPSCIVPIILPGVKKLEFSRKTLEKYSNIKLNKNPSSGSRVFPCGRREGERE